MRLGGQFVPTLAFGAALVCGCAAAPPAPGPTRAVGLAERDLFPLRPGTFWVYQVRDFQGEVTLQRVLVRGPRFLPSINAAGMIVEESGGISGELSLDVSWHPIAYYRRGDFLYKHSGINYVGNELRELRLGIGEEKLLPSDPDRYPAWENDFEVFHAGPDASYALRMLSIAKTEAKPVRVGAGEFRDCVRVETRSLALIRNGRASAQRVLYRYLDWYAPGVGLVKSVAEVEGAPRPVHIAELVSFRAGEDKGTLPPYSPNRHGTLNREDAFRLGE